MKKKSYSSENALLVLFLTIFIDLLGFGIVIPILPNFARSLQAASWQIGFLVASYSLMNFLFAPFWGGLSDKIGRKPVILISVALTGIAYVVFAYSHVLWLLFASRIIAGIGSANIAAAQAYIADISEPSQRAKNFGIIGAAFGLGLIIGPTIGGIVYENYGISVVGWLVVILCLMNLIVAFLLLPETLAEKNIALPLKINPLQDLRLALRREDIKRLLWLSFLFVTAFMMIQPTLALLWKEQAGLNDKQNGYAFAFMGVVTTLMQGFLVGKLNQRFGEYKLLVFGCVALVVAGTIFPLFVSPKWFIPFELLAITFSGISSGCFTPALNALLSKAVSEQEQGRVLGINQSFGAVARIVGPAIGLAFYDVDFHLPYWIAATIAALLWYGIKFIPKVLQKKIRT
ncbi:MAG: MFS transporter [Raineya sp.]|nr:MFS transporter [Raineya sp.]